MGNVTSSSNAEAAAFDGGPARAEAPLLRDAMSAHYSAPSTPEERAFAIRSRMLSVLRPGATLASVGEVFAEEARRVFDAAYVAVSRLVGGEFEVVAIAGMHLPADQLAREVADATPETIDTYKLVFDGEAQLIEDLAATRRGAIEEHLFASGLRSFIRVPLYRGDGLVNGVVALGSPVPGRWDQADVLALREFSAVLGLVAERGELLAASEERSRKASDLTRLLSTLNVSARPEEVARIFASEVRKFLGAEAVVLHAFDHETGTRIRVATDSIAPGDNEPDRKPLTDSNSYPGMIDQPSHIYDARTPECTPRWLAEAAAGFGLGSVIAIRLDAESTPVGMIAVGSRTPGSLGQADLDVLLDVAAPLAMVLERARVVTSLRQQTQRTQAVLDILQALGPQETLEEMASPVTSALRAMYNADHCACLIIEPDGSVLLAGVDSSVVPERQAGMRSKASTLLDQVAQAGFHVIHDTEGFTGPLSGQIRLLRERGMRSAMRVLIGAASAPLGFVTVGSRMPGRYSETDARQLARIVQPLAVAVAGFRARRELEQRTMRLEYTNRILARLSAGGAPENLAAGFLAEGRILFDCEHGMAIHFDEAQGSARLLGIDSEVWHDPTEVEDLAFANFSAGRLVEHPIPQAIADIRAEASGGKIETLLIESGLYSVIRAPLLVHDRVRGAVCFWKRGAGAFSDDDADLLGTLTRPLGIALEKAAALASLGESELKYRSLVAQAEEMIFLFDGETHAILDANSYTARALGYTQGEILGLRLDDIADATAEEIASQVSRTLEDGELHTNDRRYLRKDGSRIDVDAVASLVSYGGRQAVLVLARDISEHKSLQRQLLQGQKMESLGAMAGNVAHDFNNLLTTILGFSSLLKRSRNLDTEERENLGLIEDAARRAADLTGRLLAFSRGGLVRFGPLDLRTVVADTMRLAEPSLHASIETTLLLPGSPLTVEGDAGQLQQALLNIVLNAKDAMPEGGKISVEVSSDDTTATVVIGDTGPGMDEETRTRIFEPFFTTKPVGSGTGLGMAITYGIIQGHHGDVTVESGALRGTKFTITLPLLPLEQRGEVVDAFNAGDGNLVLVVDDDEMVRRTTSATLAELGYNVVEAPGGATAVQVVRARPERFSAVLLDLVMPGMTGAETFWELTGIRADLPVIVCTGYAADAHIDTDMKRRIAGLVQKPFTAERLARALQAAGAAPTRRA